MDGFTGSACDTLDCPNKCSESGRCYSMQNRALRTRNINSESYVYNTVWDAKKIKGCVCDVKHTGYDCSLFHCPDGDDPLTKGQVSNEYIT